ncbi:helix-turn-helix domain-containing protein [Patescibacteria group bacterium]|nr:helix-turn-helix domain-containing protein [Patescibacteria group bacterium]MBU1123339.1 helix-turn-helix domain-containing protein [Patescibacteria group bacterium]MBU1911713.1 helix-turn-helix domain-containing protein [Patescibacteria group bacterium]
MNRKRDQLHETQQRLLELLKQNIDDPLTIRELQEELELSSSSVVQHHIQQLEKRGYLRRNPSNPKDYQVLAESPDKPVAYINLYGLAHCGPKGSVLNGDPIDRVPMATKLLGFPSEEAFMVKAKGDSMEDQIKEGDLVFARKASDADSGTIVVCVNNGEVLIKKLQKGSQVILVSLNPKYEHILASNDFRIEGIVKGIYSYPQNGQ